MLLFAANVQMTMLTTISNSHAPTAASAKPTTTEYPVGPYNILALCVLNKVKRREERVNTNAHMSVHMQCKKIEEDKNHTIWASMKNGIEKKGEE